MALFRQVYVVDVNGDPIASDSGVIYDVDDTEGTAPLVVHDTAGVPMATVSISDHGVNQAFVVADRARVRWISSSGDAEAIFESLDALEGFASGAEATALSALSQVADFLSQLGVPGGIAALNSEGHVVDANDDVVGNDTRRSGAVVFATGSQTARPTVSPDVMVLWITEGEPPVNARPGVDYWLNGGVIQ